MGIEVVEARTDEPAGQPPLLFVHGAWHGAWCWENWLPYFNERGFDCWAVSFRGHGGSDPTPMGLGGPSLRDYVADVASVAVTLPAPPVVIGHSMGGAVTQLYLAEHDDTHPLAAAILLASMPPRGVIGVLLHLMRTEPALIAKVLITRDLERIVADPERVRHLFVSDDLDAAATIELQHRVGPESYRAFLDMLVLRRPRPSAARSRPVMVLGARNDTIFGEADVRATALAYGVEPVIIDGLAHDVMLDTRWRVAADAVAEWLSARSAR